MCVVFACSPIDPRELPRQHRGRNTHHTYPYYHPCKTLACLRCSIELQCRTMSGICSRYRPAILKVNHRRHINHFVVQTIRSYLRTGDVASAQESDGAGMDRWCSGSLPHHLQNCCYADQVPNQHPRRRQGSIRQSVQRRISSADVGSYHSLPFRRTCRREELRRILSEVQGPVATMTSTAAAAADIDAVDLPNG